MFIKLFHFFKSYSLAKHCVLSGYDEFIIKFHYVVSGISRLGNSIHSSAQTWVPQLDIICIPPHSNNRKYLKLHIFNPKCYIRAHFSLSKKHLDEDVYFLIYYLIRDMDYLCLASIASFICCSSSKRYWSFFLLAALAVSLLPESSYKNMHSICKLRSYYSFVLI